MRPPLTGLRVLDLSWVMVGPVSGRYLADLGAEVIKVESSRRVDPLRTLGPYRNGQPHLEQSLSYQNINAGKRSLTLDLNAPAGRDIVRTLVRHVDVVIESFTAGTLERMGLGWAQLSAENPRLVMASSCLFGQTGPERAASGVGTLGAAYSGASMLVGWPDRAPTGPFGPWTDAVTPRFIVACILAALRRRDAEGRGCYIDVSQAEAGLQFLLPAFYDAAANGRVPERMGDDPDPQRAPSGLFPCAGDDRWIAIDASADPHWRALRALAAPALDDPAFDTLIGRLRTRTRLHDTLCAWTRGRDPHALEQLLQAQGIPAHVACTSSELSTDPDLLADGHYTEVTHPDMGAFPLRNAQCRIRPAATLDARPGPRIGDGTEQILREIGGYSDAQVAEFRAAGVLV